MRIKNNNGQKFWEVLEGKIGKILSILGSDLLPELLVNVYSYPLMVKSVPCCCVCGSLLF